VSGNAHILVVDDEAEVRDLLQEYLIKQDFAVSTAASVSEARAVLAARQVDLVVLDLRMPGEDGLSLARDLHGRGDIGVVMLTASGDTMDRVVGLEIGADDYVGKPFDPRELLARIRSVLRRTRVAVGNESPAERRTVRLGCCLLDLETRQLFTVEGTEVPITAMEFDLLAAFARHPNRVLSREQLLDLTNKDGSFPFDRSIDIRVARLRQKIERYPDKPQTIKTVRGAGYIFLPGGQMPELGS
jgi:two-component system phosphate regulon response regulator OmpR